MPTLPQIPVSVPSTLLQRRPDIAIAERQLAAANAANAAVGVAIAAYYPTIRLCGSDGFSQSPLANLLQLANHGWSLGADLGLQPFEGGARHAQVAAARAGYAAAVANYGGSVLTAFQNVEDDLSSVRILGSQAQALDASRARRYPCRAIRQERVPGRHRPLHHRRHRAGDPLQHPATRARRARAAPAGGGLADRRSGWWVVSRGDSIGVINTLNQIDKPLKISRASCGMPVD